MSFPKIAPFIAVLSEDPEVLAAIRAPAAGRGAVATTTSWRRFEWLVRERPVTFSVLDEACLPGAERVAAAVAGLRARYSSVPQVVVARPGTGLHSLFRMGRAGIDNVVLVSMEDVRAGMARASLRALADSTPALVTRVVRPYLPERETRALRLALEGVQYGWSTERLSRAAGLSRPHLSVRLKAAGLPSAGQLVIWAKLLHAGRWLADAGRSAESVSRQLDYSSGSAFRRALRNFTGSTPTEVAEAGGFHFVLDLFLATFGLHASRAEGRSAA